MFFFRYAFLIAVTFASKRKGDDLDGNQDKKRQKSEIWDSYPIQPTRDITNFICSKVSISLVVQDPVVSDHNKNFTCELIETDQEEKDKIRRLCSDSPAFGEGFHFYKADDLTSALLDPLWSIIFPWHKFEASPIAPELIEIGKNLFSRLNYDYRQTQDEKTLMNLNSTAYRLLYSLLMIDQDIENFSDILSKEAVEFLKTAPFVLFNNKIGPKKALKKQFLSVSDKFERNIAAAFMIKYIITDSPSPTLTLKLRNFESTSLISELPFWSNLRIVEGLDDYMLSIFQSNYTTYDFYQHCQKFLLDLHLEHTFEVYNLNLEDEEANSEPSYTMHPQFLYTVNLFSSTPFPVKYLSVKFKELFKKIVPRIQENELLENMADAIRILPPDFFKINKITKLSLENQQAISFEQASVYDISCFIKLNLNNFSNLVKALLLQSGTYLLASLRKHGIKNVQLNYFSFDAIYQCYVSSLEGSWYIKQRMHVLSMEALSIIENTPNPWEPIWKLGKSPETLGKMPETAEALRQFFLSYKDSFPKIPLNPIEGLEASNIVELYDFEELFHDVPREIWMVFFGFVSNKIDITWNIPFDLALKLAFDPFFSCLVPWNRLEKSINLYDLRLAINYLLNIIFQKKLPNVLTMTTSGRITSEGRLKSLIEKGMCNSYKHLSAWDIIVFHDIFHSDGKNHYNISLKQFSDFTTKDMQTYDYSGIISFYAFVLYDSHSEKHFLPRIQELSSGFSVLWLVFERFGRSNAEIFDRLFRRNRNFFCVSEFAKEILFTFIFKVLQHANNRHDLEAEMNALGLLEFLRRCTRNWLSKTTISNAFAMMIFNPSLIPWFHSSKITIKDGNQTDQGTFVARDMSEIVPVLDDAFFFRHFFISMNPRTTRSLRLKQVLFYQSNALSQLNWDNLDEIVRAGLMATNHKIWDILATSQVFNAENWKYITIEYLKSNTKTIKPAILGSLIKNLKSLPLNYQEEILKLSDTLKIEVTKAFLSTDKTFPSEALSKFDNPSEFTALQKQWNAKLMASIAAKIRNNPLPNIMSTISALALPDEKKLKLVFEQDWGRPIFSNEQIASITIEQFEYVCTGFYLAGKARRAAFFKNCRLYFRMMINEVKSLAAAVLFNTASKYDVINESFDYEVFHAISNKDFEKIVAKSGDNLGFVLALNLDLFTPFQLSHIEDIALRNNLKDLYRWLVKSFSAGYCLKLRPSMWTKIFTNYPKLFIKSETLGQGKNTFLPSERQDFLLFLGALADNLRNFPVKMQEKFMKLAMEDQTYFLGVLASPTNIHLDKEFWKNLPQHMFDALKIVFSRGHLEDVNWAIIPSAHVNIAKYHDFMTKEQTNQLSENELMSHWIGTMSVVFDREKRNTEDLENDK